LSVQQLMIPAFDIAQLREITALVSASRHIAIIPHHKPDGDAMGAALALYNYFQNKNKKAVVITPGSYPGFLQWMKGNDAVLDFEKQPEKAKQALLDAQIIFCVDFNAPQRVEDLEKPLLGSKAKKVLLDHHLDPQTFCDYAFSFPEASSTCELVYHFIVQSGDRDRITKDIAECLYTGIMTDTGSFRFPSMSSDAHHIIAELMAAGASNHKIHELIFDNYSADRIRLVGYCISEKLVILKEFNTAYMSVTERELRSFNHATGDTEGIVNYGLGIKGIRMAAFFSERDGLIKISFRSKGDFSVEEIASKYFEGGGHKNAAGGKTEATMEKTIQRFLEILPEYKNELTAK